MTYFSLSIKKVKSSGTWDVPLMKQPSWRLGRVKQQIRITHVNIHQCHVPGTIQLFLTCAHVETKQKYKQNYSSQTWFIFELVLSEVR